MIFPGVASLIIKASVLRVLLLCLNVWWSRLQARPRYCALFGSSLYCFVAKGKDLLGQWELRGLSAVVSNTNLVVTITTPEDAVQLEARLFWFGALLQVSTFYLTLV
jgi:hypothetical protein